MRVWRWPARWRCHGSIWCCQRVDGGLCGGLYDPHPIAHWFRTRRTT